MARKTVTADQFKAAMVGFQEKTLKNIVLDAQKGITRDLHRLLVTGHPVLTGFSRSNWNGSIGVKDTSVSKGRARVSRTGAGVQSDERSRLNAVLDGLNVLPLGQKIWLTNGVTYVKFLEHGSSKKAPAGIAAPAIATVLEKARAGKYSGGSR